MGYTACLSHHTGYKSESVEFCLSADSVPHENGVAAFHEDQTEDDACLRDTTKELLGIVTEMTCIRNLHDVFCFDIATCLQVIM